MTPVEKEGRGEGEREKEEGGDAPRALSYSSDILLYPRSPRAFRSREGRGRGWMKEAGGAIKEVIIEAINEAREEPSEPPLALSKPGEGGGSPGELAEGAEGIPKMESGAARPEEGHSAPVSPRVGKPHWMVPIGPREGDAQLQEEEGERAREEGEPIQADVEMDVEAGELASSRVEGGRTQAEGLPEVEMASIEGSLAETRAEAPSTLDDPPSPREGKIDHSDLESSTVSEFLTPFFHAHGEEKSEYFCLPRSESDDRMAGDQIFSDDTPRLSRSRMRRFNEATRRPVIPSFEASRDEKEKEIKDPEEGGGEVSDLPIGVFGLEDHKEKTPGIQRRASRILFLQIPPSLLPLPSPS
jgi:hypothetical protein